MFGEAEFRQALSAYARETSKRGGDEFTALRRSQKFFLDIKSKEKVEEQIRLFADMVSKMDRDEYSHRYVLQSFLMEFCKYLDKDFLFSITDGKSFFRLRERLKEFTGEIYDTHKKFTQAIALNSIEHLLEDYGTLLKFVNLDEVEYSDRRGEKTESSEKTSGENPFNMFGKLW